MQSHIKMGSTATLALDSIPLTKHIPSTPCPPSSSTWAGCAWDGEWRLGLPGLHPTGGVRWSPNSHPQGLFIMANLKHVSSPNSSILKVPQLDPLLQADQFNRINQTLSPEFWAPLRSHSCLVFLPKKHVASGAAAEGNGQRSLCFAGWGDFVPFVLMRHLRSSESWSFEPEGDVRMDRWSTSQ